MSDALAMPLPQPAPSIGRNWIKANVMAALVSIAVGLVALLLGHGLGAGKADTSTLAQVMVVLAYVLAVGTGAAAYSVLSGRVLREKLPAFPMHTWVALHVAVGLLIGLLAGYGALQSPADAKEMINMSRGLMIGMAVVVAVAGIFGGLVVGSIQALIMRKAAQGLGAWIGCSAVAGLLGVMVYGLLFVMGQPLPSMTGDILAQATAFFSAIIMAVAMLPAMARLSPR